jgi:uncharacterized membrane protein YfcA
MDFSFLSYDLLLFIALGFFAQLVDGALGMAYGLIVTTTLLSLGTAPALASASVHAAEVVTTGLASASHAWHRNIDWALFRKLAPAGVGGGIVGAYILTELPQDWLKVFVTFYLIVMTAMITHRVLVSGGAVVGTAAQRERKLPAAAVGGAGGFLDAVGGGGWGPIATSTLISRGDHPRHTIGTVSISEFFVTVAISVTFLINLELSTYLQPVLGLVIGGAAAAPLAGYLSRVLPPRFLMIAVAVVVGILSLVNIGRLAWPAANAAFIG